MFIKRTTANFYLNNNFNFGNTNHSAKKSAAVKANIFKAVQPMRESAVTRKQMCRYPVQRFFFLLLTTKMTELHDTHFSQKLD